MEKTVTAISCYKSTRSKIGNKGNNTVGKQEKHQRKLKKYQETCRNIRIRNGRKQFRNWGNITLRESI